MKATSTIQGPHISEAEKDTVINQKIDAITQRDPCLGQKSTIMTQLRYVDRCRVRREQTEQCGRASFKATRMQGNMQKKRNLGSIPSSRKNIQNGGLINTGLAQKQTGEC